MTTADPVLPSGGRPMTTQEIITGDARDLLLTLPENSVHAVVTDPPYALNFLNHRWDTSDDNIAFDPCFWAQVLRVLRPGGHILAFGGTRTHHHMAIAMVTAGFEERDTLLHAFDASPAMRALWESLDDEQRELMLQAFPGGAYWAWCYGTGFPKSHNLDGDFQGFGTALKPAHEPIYLMRKPLEKGLSVAANALKWGAGALNIDTARIGDRADCPQISGAKRGSVSTGKINVDGGKVYTLGRWPANLILSHSDHCIDGGACVPGP